MRWKMTRLTISKISQLNTLVIKQKEGRDFFIATPSSIVISVDTLAFILKFLVQNNYMSKKVLEGILQDVEHRI